MVHLMNGIWMNVLDTLKSNQTKRAQMNIPWNILPSFIFTRAIFE